jgi:membrane-bound serine protease (ClpP class)
MESGTNEAIGVIVMEDILLNPNVAYLLLVAGFTFATLSLLSPGTGLLEIGALFSILLAGWGIYNLPVNWWALGLLLLGVFPFLLAVRRSGRLIYLGISILALVAGSAFLFRGEGWRPAVEPVLALVVSALVSGFFWVVVRKALEAERVRPSHDLGALVGLPGEAKSEIHAEGTVQVAGELWTARSEQVIPDGARVRVTGREGFILDVEPEPGEPELSHPKEEQQLNTEAQHD